MGCGGCLMMLLPLAPIFFSGWMLRPVHSTQRGSAVPATFRLTDAACLVFLLSATASLASVGNRLLGELPDKLPLFLFLFSTWLLVGAMWWGGIRSLNALGIKRSLPRCLYLTLATPLAYIGVTLFPAVAVIAIMSSMQEGPTILKLLFITLPFAGYLACRSLTRWVARQASSTLIANVTAQAESPIDPLLDEPTTPRDDPEV